jgi:hypothetical protein
MKIQRIISFILGLCLLTLGNGCVTKNLWESNGLEAWKQPDASPNLHLFAARQPADILIVYDEYSERRGVTHTRAYWLSQNDKIIRNGHAPHFVKPESAAGCATIPVFLTTTNEINSPPPYAVLAGNGQSFTLHSPNGLVGSYGLPYYNDGKGKYEKFMMTPLATAADITIVGAIIGYIYAEGQTGGYNSAY